jgi:2-polyprenyl-3-methyl-5-hydroxy-6-metoxy-1,4-benzoquinol methylase
MTTYVKDTCPVCECKKYSVIGRINEKDPPVIIPEESIIVECNNCKLIYVNPMPYWDDEDYAKLYNEAYFSHMNADMQKKWLDVRKNRIPQKRYSRIANNIKTDKKKILEIGAGEYAFMCRYLMSKEWDVTAQEPSMLYAEKLRSINGLKVETKGIKELEGDGEYSLIFADSVLEHVPDPIPYYQKLSKLLVRGGVLYTVSPNEYSVYNFLLNFIAKSKGATPHYIAPYTQPYHLIGFTKKSLKLLAQNSGLSLISYRKIDDYMAFHTLNSSRNVWVKYPLALLHAVSQSIGLGTNGEALFVKM